MFWQSVDMDELSKACLSVRVQDTRVLALGPRLCDPNPLYASPGVRFSGIYDKSCARSCVMYTYTFIKDWRHRSYI